MVTLLHERDGLGAMTASAWRMVLAAAALVVFAVVTGRIRAALATLRTHPWLVALVGCGTAVYQGLYFVSVLLAGVSVATVVSLGLAPVLAAIWEHATARTMPSGRDLGVLVAALVGLGLVVGGGTRTAIPEGGSPALGVILAIAAGGTYAATTLLGHRLARRVDPVALTTSATAVGAVALAPFLVVAAVEGQPVMTSSPASLGLLIYLGVATMALAYVLLYAGLRTTTGSAATVATLVEPLSAAVLAVVLLGERPTAIAVVGGLLILAAVVALRPSDTT